MAQLNTYVCVRDANGLDEWFGPGMELPEWAVAKITNPAAYASGGPLDTAPAAAPAATMQADVVAEVKAPPVRRPRKAGTA